MKLATEQMIKGTKPGSYYFISMLVINRSSKALVAIKVTFQRG
jgi:hypothetical protein